MRESDAFFLGPKWRALPFSQFGDAIKSEEVSSTME